jgi:hypothetical protein
MHDISSFLYRDIFKVLNLLFIQITLMIRIRKVNDQT